MVVWGGSRHVARSQPSVQQFLVLQPDSCPFLIYFRTYWNSHSYKWQDNLGAGLHHRSATVISSTCSAWHQTVTEQTVGLLEWKIRPPQDPGAPKWEQGLCSSIWTSWIRATIGIGAAVTCYVEVRLDRCVWWTEKCLEKQSKYYSGGRRNSVTALITWAVHLRFESSTTDTSHEHEIIW